MQIIIKRIECLVKSVADPFLSLIKMMFIRENLLPGVQFKMPTMKVHIKKKFLNVNKEEAEYLDAINIAQGQM